MFSARTYGALGIDRRPDFCSDALLFNAPKADEVARAIENCVPQAKAEEYWYEC